MRVAAVERLLVNWAVWKRSGRSAADVEALEVEAAVASLHPDLEATVNEIYLGGADMSEHVRRLGCPEWIVSRRLGQAHRTLSELDVKRRQVESERHASLTYRVR